MSPNGLEWAQMGPGLGPMCPNGPGPRPNGSKWAQVGPGPGPIAWAQMGPMGSNGPGPRLNWAQWAQMGLGANGSRAGIQAHGESRPPEGRPEDSSIYIVSGNAYKVSGNAYIF